MKSLTLRRAARQARRRARAWPGAACALLAAALLAGCSDGRIATFDSSQVLDALDPFDWFSDSGPPVDPALAERLAAERARPIPGADSDYPAVGLVPGEAPEVTPPEVRRRAMAQLAAGEAPDLSPPGPESALAANAAWPLRPGEAEHAAVIYFAHGSAALADGDRAVLRRVADIQRAHDAVLRVVGHASAGVGDDASAGAKLANFRAALRRAQAVAGALARFGVPRSRIEVESRSDNDPAWSNATPLGEAANRRADVYFIAPGDG